jgi:hypothetical protein
VDKTGYRYNHNKGYPHFQELFSPIPGKKSIEKHFIHIAIDNNSLLGYNFNVIVYSESAPICSAASGGERALFPEK